jgi:hypothetical protein
VEFGLALNVEDDGVSSSLSIHITVLYDVTSCSFTFRNKVLRFCSESTSVRWGREGASGAAAPVSRVEGAANWMDNEYFKRRT